MPLFPGIFASAISGHLTPADAGSYFPIGEFTLASAQSEINFTNIPQTYTHLQIRLIARSTRNVASSTETILGVRAGNGSIDTGNNYSYHALGGDGSSAFVGALTSNSSMPLGYISAFNATAGQFGIAVIDILDYKSTNKNKTFRCLTGVDRNGAGQVRFTSGSWMNSSSAIDTIRLFDYNGSGDFVQYTSAALYGVL